MVGVVKSEATDGADGLLGKRSQKVLDAHNLLGDGVSSKNVAGNNAGELGLGKVGSSGGEDSISVVNLAVTRQEADKALERHYCVKIRG